MNCWEYYKCPPEVHEKCPAHPDNGRECWKMLSTLCAGGRQEAASLVEKVAFCRSCDFFIKYARDYCANIYTNLG